MRAYKPLWGEKWLFTMRREYCPSDRLGWNSVDDFVIPLRWFNVTFFIWRESP